jgi:hypothetical protein
VPFYITPPGQSDVLLVIMVLFVLSLVLLLGVLYFRLHALPEQISHNANNKAQFEIVAVLALLALFTHNNLFWVAALILAMIRFPDYQSPLDAMAASLRRLSGHPPADDAPPAVAEPKPAVTEKPDQKGV